MKESSLYPKIKKWILESYPNAWVYRVTETFRVGIPDMLACIDGLFLAIEVKSSKAYELTAIQQYEIEQIKKAGGFGVIVKGNFLYWQDIEYNWLEKTAKEIFNGQYTTIPN